MKRIVAIFLIAVLALTGCAAHRAPEPQVLPLPELAPSPAPSPTPSAYEYRVGALLIEQSEFNDGLIAEMTRDCDAMAAELTVRYGATAEEQTAAADELIAAGVQLLVIDPADIDNSSDIIEAAQSAGVPIINVMTPVNGAVDTLIAPDYDEMGAMLGRAAKEIGGGDVSVLVLGGSEQDFIMQMETDGIRAGAGSGAVLDIQYCDWKPGAAADAVTNALAAGAPEVIAAFNADMAAAAAEAVSRQASGTPIVCIGLSQQVQSLFDAGTMSCVVYCQPENVAAKAMFHTKMYFVSDGYELPYYDTITLNQLG